MWYLIVWIPDLCTLTYFDELASVLPTVYRHIENMLEIHVCFTNHAHLLPTKLDKCRYFGSGKCQGILLFIICGNPDEIWVLVDICVNASLHALAYVPCETRSRPIIYASSEGSGETAH